MHTAIDCGILSQRLEFQQVCIPTYATHSDWRAGWEVLCVCVVSFSTNDTHFDTRVELTSSRVSFSCSSTHSGKLVGRFYVCVWCHSALTVLTLTQESNLPLVESNSAVAVLTLESWVGVFLCV